MNNDLKQYILKLAKKRGLVKGASYDFYTSKTNEYAGRRNITEEPYFNESFSLVHNGYVIWRPEKGWFNIYNIQLPKENDELEKLVRPLADYIQKHYDLMVQINVGVYDYEVVRKEEGGKITEEMSF